MAKQSFRWDILGVRFPRGITFDNGYPCERPSRLFCCIILSIGYQYTSIFHGERVIPKSRLTTRN